MCCASRPRHTPPRPPPHALPAAAPRSSAHDHAAIHVEHLPRHVSGRGVQRQEAHHASDLLGLPVAACGAAGRTRRPRRASHSSGSGGRCQCVCLGGGEGWAVQHAQLPAGSGCAPAHGTHRRRRRARRALAAHSPRGMPARICASYFSGIAAVMSEAIKPGATALHVMLRPAYSRAVVLVSPITPAFGRRQAGRQAGAQAGSGCRQMRWLPSL
jgi:hypothetical protein